MSDIDIFRNEFVPNIQSHSRLSFASWQKSAPADYARWVIYRDAVLAGKPAAPPSMTTKYGKALVAAGKLVTGSAPPPPPPPAGLYWNGDFDTGDLSQFHDFHDAQLHRTPPGVQVVSSPRFGNSGYAARINVTDEPDSSGYGDATMLWADNEYSNPWLQEGQTTWFRLQFAFPNGTDPNFPGFWMPTAGSFSILYTWHTNPGIVPNAYSTNLRVHGGNGIPGDSGDPISLLFHVRGGSGDGESTYLYHTNGAPQTQANRIPVQWNKWYDVVLRITFGRDANSGSVEWYVDGVSQTGANCPTIAIAADGSCPGLGYEAGYYRGPTKPGLESIYIDGMRAGPTKASVEA